MKKSFTIEVFIDTKTTGPSTCQKIREGEYTVEVQHHKGTSYLASLLHELGHVLAQEILAPAHKVALQHTLYGEEALLSMEKEAWIFAEKIFQQSKEFCLAKYAEVRKI